MKCAHETTVLIGAPGSAGRGLRLMVITNNKDLRPRLVSWCQKCGSLKIDGEKRRLHVRASK